MRPNIDRVLETALYVRDVPRAAAFYREILGLTTLFEDARLAAMDAGSASVLLLFQSGASLEGAAVPGGFIPPHDGSGPAHVAFAVTKNSLPAWEARLSEAGIAIESRVRWERGGSSLYFRDPDGHSLELVTPHTWATY